MTIGRNYETTHTARRVVQNYVNFIKFFSFALFFLFVLSYFSHGQPRLLKFYKEIVTTHKTNKNKTEMKRKNFKRKS